MAAVEDLGGPSPDPAGREQLDGQLRVQEREAPPRVDEPDLRGEDGGGVRGVGLEAGEAGDEVRVAGLEVAQVPRLRDELGVGEAAVGAPDDDERGLVQPDVVQRAVGLREAPGVGTHPHPRRG